jgi:hypothetical protein
MELAARIGPVVGRHARHALRRASPLAAVVAALVPLVLVVNDGVAQTTATQDTPGHVWLGPDGKPLPFRTDGEVLEFLRDGRVVGREKAPGGINRPDVLLLERDGVRARAIFRTARQEKRRTRIAGRYYVRFVDSYTHEGAAFVLAEHLGFDFVPPVVDRRVDSTEGTLQIWVEGTIDWTAADFRYPSPMVWVKKGWDRDFFDNLILNTDRNMGNILVGPDYEIWLIDYTRAFQPQAELLDPEKLTRVPRTAWDRLQATSDEELKDLVREYLDTEQLQALVARRSLLVKHVARLVEEHGEADVFY